MKRSVTRGGKAGKARWSNPKRGRTAAIANSRASDADLKRQPDGQTGELAQARKLLAEALEQQVATADVLKVISSSRGDLQPVFQAILAHATRICEAKFGNLILYENGVYRDAALFGAPPAFAALRARNSVVPVGPNSTLAKVVQTKRPLHIANAADDPLYTVQRDPARVDMVEVAHKVLALADEVIE